MTEKEFEELKLRKLKEGLSKEIEERLKRIGRISAYGNRAGFKKLQEHLKEISDLVSDIYQIYGEVLAIGEKLKKISEDNKGDK